MTKKLSPNHHKTDKNLPTVRTYARAQAGKHICTKKRLPSSPLSPHRLTPHLRTTYVPHIKYNWHWLREPGATLERALADKTLSLLADTTAALQRANFLIGQLAEAMTAAAKLHHPHPTQTGHALPDCAECIRPWPCPTVRTLRDQLRPWIEQANQ